MDEETWKKLYEAAAKKALSKQVDKEIIERWNSEWGKKVSLKWTKEGEEWRLRSSDGLIDKKYESPKPDYIRKLEQELERRINPPPDCYTLLPTRRRAAGAWLAGLPYAAHRWLKRGSYAPILLLWLSLMLWGSTWKHHPFMYIVCLILAALSVVRRNNTFERGTSLWRLL